MDRLGLVLILVTGPILAGGLVIIVLSLGWYSWVPIVSAAAVGLLLAIPAAHMVAREIKRRDPNWNRRRGKSGTGGSGAD